MRPAPPSASRTGRRPASPIPRRRPATASFWSGRRTTRRETPTAAPGSLTLAGLGLDLARDRRLDTLSGGQRSRVGLAALLIRRPSALLLDEPTDHLSPALADELEEALGTSPGAVVVASHDRWLRRRWSGRELTL